MRSSRPPAAAFRQVRDRSHELRRPLATLAPAAAMALVIALAAAGCGSASKTARSAPATSRTTSVTSARGYLGAGATADHPPVNPAVYKACRAGQVTTFIPASTYIAGYADASKQNGAVPVGFPDLAAAVTANPQEGFGGAPPVVVKGQTYTCSIVKLQLDYNGVTELPPVTATFLAFGFMPVTATINLVQLSPGPILAVVYQDASMPASVPSYTAVSATVISVQLTDVKVNGVPLNVGGNCHSSGPVYTPELDTELGLPNTAVLTGGNAIGDPLPLYGQAPQGGSLAGMVTIPPFVNCKTPAGENLDALLTASVSGAGNYLKVVQGPLCEQPPGTPPSPNCTPQGLPTREPVWTVTHGGSYTGTGQAQISQISEPATGGTTITTTLSCPGSITGEIPDFIGPLRDADLGTVNWPDATCTGTSTGRKASIWSLQQERGPAFLDGKVYPFPTPGIMSGNIDDLTFVLIQKKGTEPGCEVTLAGNTGATYADASGTLAMNVSERVPVTSSNCQELPVSGGPGGTDGLDEPANITGTYALNPSDISIVSP
jgi:hypothetical protein